MCPTPLHPGVGQPCPRGNGESLGSGIDTDTSLIMSLVGPCVETLYINVSNSMLPLGCCRG